MARHPLIPEELALSYSKYWFWKWPEKNPLSQELMREPMDEKDMLPFTEIDRLLDPGYQAREQGWCVSSDGLGYHADYIWMPGVTVEMIDWWFVWHFSAPKTVPAGNGNLRYKIWNPNEHVDTGFSDEASRLRAIDESIPMRERRYGAKNFIHETLDGGEGDNVLFLTAECHDPVDFGFDARRLQDPASGTVIAGITTNMHCPTIYQFRPYGDGVEMRVRDYFGVDYVEGTGLVRTPGFTADPVQVYNSAQHILAEYPNLARFLPQLYAEERNKPIDAY